MTTPEQALIRNSLAMTSVFGRWRPELIARLAASAQLRHYKRGDSVATGRAATREALMVVSGSLEVSVPTRTDRRFITGIIGAGRTTGLVRLARDLDLEYGYVAWEKSAVIHFRCTDVLAMLEAEPSHWADIMLDLSVRHSEQVGSLIDQILGSPGQRIAATLRRLSTLFGFPESNGMRLRLRLSQDDLADMLSVSRQTVSREMKRLEHIGAIAFTYNTVFIMDRAALDSIAAKGPLDAVQPAPAD